MTILSLNASVSADVRSGKMFFEGSSSTSQSRALPRISLRKRAAGIPKKVPLQTVNSAFLSGLFADVANATISTTAAVLSEGGEEDHLRQPVKKTRISKTMSLSRCARSFKMLNEDLCEMSPDEVPVSPAQADTNFFANEAHESFYPSCSLHDQLNLVSPNSGADVTSAANLTFPNLSATVSSPTCSAATATATFAAIALPSSASSSKLIRVISDLQSSVSDEDQTTPQESYGWFVPLDQGDDENSDEESRAVPCSSPCGMETPLAFSAYTAPKGSNHDAEVEWAKAADTVDDVLGDFF